MFPQIACIMCRMSKLHSLNSEATMIRWWPLSISPFLRSRESLRSPQSKIVKKWDALDPLMAVETRQALCLSFVALFCVLRKGWSLCATKWKSSQAMLPKGCISKMQKFESVLHLAFTETEIHSLVQFNVFCVRSSLSNECSFRLFIWKPFSSFKILATLVSWI